jgi:hypothetical protein
VNVHVDARAFASLAVHVTGSWPTGNAEPEAGEHVVVTGDWPPLTAGAGNDTTCEVPSSDVAESAVGHAIDRVGVGLVGECPPHAAATAHAQTASRQAACIPSRTLANEAAILRER